MKHIYLIAIIFLNWGFMSAQFMGPIAVTSGVCSGYTMEVNSVEYTVGPNSVLCWDTNGNGLADPAEDTNNDGVLNALDCAGGNGCWDLNGNGQLDSSEDINGNGIADIFDCPDCWDTNFNDLEDPAEDINGDGLWDANDCTPFVDGCYSAPTQDVPVASSYSITLDVNADGYDNGLNTVDVVIVLDYLALGFPDSKSIVAADFDGNGTISTKDITEMYRLITGLDTNNSYQNYFVVPKGFSFPTLDPFDFEVDYSTLEFTDADLDDNQIEINVFKSGDMDNSAR